MNRWRFALWGLAIVVCLSVLGPFSSAQEGPAIAAYNRGQEAFAKGNFTLARDQFSESYARQNRPVTAYFLSYACMKLRDYTGAKQWGQVALRSSPSFPLDETYRDGAREIVEYAKAQLAPKPPPAPQAQGIGISTSAITMGPPRPPVPAPLPSPPAPKPNLKLGSGAKIGAMMGSAAKVQPAIAQPAIQVLTATYGANCGAPHGNATTHISTGCNGKDVCKYTVDFTVLGDPVPGCVKEYDVAYGCTGSKAQKGAHVGGEEAGFKKVVVLSCP